MRLLRNFIFLDRTRNMGGDISGWSARQICHYDERDLSQLVTVPNLLTSLYRIQLKKKTNLKSNFKIKSLKSIQELQPNKEEIIWGSSDRSERHSISNHKDYHLNYASVHHLRSLTLIINKPAKSISLRCFAASNGINQELQFHFVQS